MVRKVLLLVAGLWIGGSGLRAQLMQVPKLRDAPFEAVNTLIVTDSTGTHTAVGKVARSSAGSTYGELWKTDTNQLVQILIVDVPGKRFIHLDPVNKLYSIQDGQMLQAQTLPPGSSAHEILQAQDAKPTHKENNGLTEDIQPLGKKEIEGVVTLGELATRRKAGPGPDAMDLTTETWTSPDLRIALVSKTHDAIRGMDHLSSLSHLRRVEPDAALFRIPAGYQQGPANAHN